MKQVNENKIQFYTLNNNRVSIFSYFSISNQAIFRENLAFTSCDQVPNSQTRNGFITLFGEKGAVSSCFKQLPSDLNLNLNLFYSSFGETLLFAVQGGLSFSFDNPLDRFPF